MMKKILIMLAVALPLLLSCAANAKPQIVTWEWPTTDCDSTILAQADLIESEIIYDTSPMPMPSDTVGACDAVGDPDAPAGATVIPVSVADNSVILNLHPGTTYFARMRVSAYVAGNWSSWSTSHQFTVPYGRPNRVIMGAMLDRWEATLIEDPAIRLN